MTWGKTSVGVREMNTEIEKKRLEKIERGVLEASRMSNDELEDIVAAPHLSRSIKANVERQRSAAIPEAKKRIFAWGWQLKLATSVVLAIILGVVIGVGLSGKKQPAAPVAKVNNEADVAVDQPKNFDAFRAIALDEGGRIDQPVIQRASLKTRELRTLPKQRPEEIEEVS